VKAGQRIAGVLGVALLAPALLSACGGSSSTESSSSTAASLGPPPVATFLRIRAGSTTLVVNPRRVIFPLRGSGALLAPGDRAAGVEVTLRNAGHAVYDSSSESDVKLRTSAGSFAAPAFASSGPCATSEVDFLKEVEPGESRSGCVAFDLPEGTKPVSVRFSPEGRSSGGQTWLVKR
jgi:hypothetical protein